MPGLKHRMMDQTRRQINRRLRIEVCCIVHVRNHTTPGDLRFNTVDVIMRDRVNKADEYRFRKQVVVPPNYLGGHCMGATRSPRVGDVVLVLFYGDREAYVMGPAWSWAEYPVCRPTPYDIADKGGQWMKPYQDKWGDFPKQPYPETKKPYCFRWFHGPVKGATGKGRDWALLFDYCHLGDEYPHCAGCQTIDSICRTDNHGFKLYSSETQSKVAHPLRGEYFAPCGSYWMFESKCCEDCEECTDEHCCSEMYTEGKGFWTVQGAVDQVLKGHIRHSPTGTVDIHSTTESKLIASEATGTRVVVVAPADTTVDYAIEAKDFVTGAYIRIMKTGEIVLHSPIKITMDAPLVEETEDNKISGDNSIAGSCSHAACSCDGCGGSSTGTGSVQAIAHGLTDEEGNKVVPGEVSCCCTAAGGSCTVQYCTDTYIYVVCTNGITFVWKVRR